MTEEKPSSERSIVKNAFYLTFRHGLGIGLGFLNLLLITRLIGPANYGLYAAAVAILSSLGTVAGIGIDTYLMRAEKQPSTIDYNTAFTFVLLFSASIALLCFMATPLLAVWYQDQAFIPPLKALLTILPVYALIPIARARLERAMDYVPVVRIELGGQVAFGLVAVSLALSGQHLWAPVVAFMVAQLVVLVAFFVSCRAVPLIGWDTDRAREMVSYGLGFSSTRWPLNLMSLINPLVIGRVLGAEAVGIVALASRLLEVLGFVALVAWRLALPLLPRFRHDADQLSLVVSRASILQITGVGIPLVLFCLVGEFIVEHVFGTRWVPVMDVLPFLAIALLGQSMFQLKESVLLLFQHNLRTGLFYIFRLILLTTGAWYFSVQFGVVGYGLAFVTALPAYLIVNGLVMDVMPTRPFVGILWFIAFAALILATIVPAPWSQILIAVSIVAALHRNTRMEFIEEFRTVRAVLTDLLRRKPATDVH